MKNAHCRFSLGKCKLKQQWDTVTSIIMVKFQTTDKPFVSEDWSNRSPQLLFAWKQNGIATWEDSSSVSPKVAFALPYNVAIPYLGIWPIDLKTHIHKTPTVMFTSAFLKIGKKRKQPRYPARSECINKLWLTHITEHYSAIKRNEILSPAKTGRNLKCVLSRERSQSEKAPCCKILFVTVWKRQKYGDST